MQSPAPLTVLGLVALATTAIVCGDTAGKLLTGAGVQPLFVAWSRFALAALLLFWMLGLGPAGLGRLLDWRLILRAALIVGAIASILTALRTEPIANVFGAFFIGPIVAYVLSALLLGESVSWARTVMLALGFAGVLLVVRPGGEMGTGMIFAVLAGTLYGSYLAATRWLAAHAELVAGRLRANGQEAYSIGLSGTPGFLAGPMLVMGAIDAGDFGRLFARARVAN
mgnify:CR=1 FL=1